MFVPSTNVPRPRPTLCVPCVFLVLSCPYASPSRLPSPPPNGPPFPHTAMCRAVLCRPVPCCTARQNQPSLLPSLPPGRAIPLAHLHLHFIIPSHRLVAARTGPHAPTNPHASLRPSVASPPGICFCSFQLPCRAPRSEAPPAARAPWCMRPCTLPQPPTYVASQLDDVCVAPIQRKNACNITVHMPGEYRGVQRWWKMR